MISLNYLIHKYRCNISGVSHFGAHLGQEVNAYLENNIDHIHLFEPQSNIFEALYKKYKDIDSISFYNFGLGNNEETVSIFLDSNKKESSSILKPKKHISLYPDIIFEGTEDIQIKKYDSLSITNVNFLNIDVQGYELIALMGSENSLNEIDYIYTEVNNEELYENCSLVDEIDRFLKFHNFIRVTTAWHDDLAWGDAFYINKNLISLRVYWFSLLKNFIFKINIFKYINLKFFQLISFVKKRWYRFKKRIKSFI